MNYVLHLLIIFCLYAVLAVGQSLLLGVGNMLFVTQAAAFGIGAYTWAILVMSSVPSEVAIIIAVLVAVAIIVPISLPTLRLRGDYLLVASLAIGEVVRSFLNNTPSLTGGAQGMAAVSKLSLLTFTLSESWQYLVIAAFILVLATVIHTRINTSPLGWLLRASGEGGDSLSGEIAMRALGKPVRQTRSFAVMVAAGTAALAGVIYASYFTYLDPNQFGMWESVVVLGMVILGGMGSATGAILGAAAFVLLPESLRFVGLPSGLAGPLRQVTFGVVLLIILRLRPRGLLRGGKA